MRTRSVLWLICLAAVGCGGQLEPAAADEEAALGRWPPISLGARPDVSWEFFNCLDADHRQGLVAAMLDLSTRQYYSAALPLAMSGAIADSRCIDGQERGGLFRGNPSADDRALGLNALNILPSLSGDALSVSRSLIVDVAAKQYAALPKRFDADGHINWRGRFLVNGYTVGTDNDLQIKVLDTTNNRSVYIQTGGPIGMTGAYDWISCSSYPNIIPYRDDNPLVQTVINATEQYLAVNKSAEMLRMGPTCGAIEALQLYYEPSMRGWYIPYSEWSLDKGRSNRFTVFGVSVVR